MKTIIEKLQLEKVKEDDKYRINLKTIEFDKEKRILLINGVDLSKYTTAFLLSYNVQNEPEVYMYIDSLVY